MAKGYKVNKGGKAPKKVTMKHSMLMTHKSMKMPKGMMK